MLDFHSVQKEREREMWLEEKAGNLTFGWSNLTCDRTGLSAVYVSGGRASRYRLPRGSGTERTATVPRPAWTTVWIHMRTGKADKSSHATPFGRTGKKGRQTCVTGYCARCKSCLLFNKNNTQHPVPFLLFFLKLLAIAMSSSSVTFWSKYGLDLICLIRNHHLTGSGVISFARTIFLPTRKMVHWVMLSQVLRIFVLRINFHVKYTTSSMNVKRERW